MGKLERGNSIDAVFQSVIDFLIEDRCALCGGSGEPPVVAKAVGPFASALIRPVRARLLGLFSVSNHPVCWACVDGFDESRRPGTLGWAGPEGRVTTSRGDAFVGRPPQAPAASAVAAGGIRAVEAPGARDIPIVAPFMTNDNVLKLIHLLKFASHRSLVPLVASAMAAAVGAFRRSLPPGAALVPAPMDAAERRRRGFNQAEEIARALGGDLELPVIGNGLKKMRRTKRQSQTEPDWRAENVRGVFSVQGVDFGGRTLLFVDDLVTTGATAGSCTAELFAAGAASVSVVAFGRAF